MQRLSVPLWTRVEVIYDTWEGTGAEAFELKWAIVGKLSRVSKWRCLHSKRGNSTFCFLIYRLNMPSIHPWTGSTRQLTRGFRERMELSENPLWKIPSLFGKGWFFSPLLESALQTHTWTLIPLLKCSKVKSKTGRLKKTCINPSSFTCTWSSLLVCRKRCLKKSRREHFLTRMRSVVPSARWAEGDRPFGLRGHAQLILAALMAINFPRITLQPRLPSEKDGSGESEHDPTCTLLRRTF